MNPTGPARTLRAFILRLGGVFAGNGKDRELADEFESHLEMEIEDNLRAGMPPAEARRAALLKTGGLALAQENYRDRRGLPFIDNTLRDLQYAGRILRRSPAFTLVAVLSLAFGIGANTAIFSIVNAVMLRSLPVEDPSRLVQIKQDRQGTLSNPVWEQIRNHTQVFSGTLAYCDQRFDLAGGGESQFAQGLWVSGDFFRVLGVVPMKGRVLGRYDDHRGAPALAVLSYSFWQRRFGGDPHIVGKTVRLNRLPFEIIGVTPPWFTGVNVDRGFDVALPIASEPLFHPDRSWLEERSTWWLTILGRLRPEEDSTRAAAGLKLLSPEIVRATLPADWDAKDQADYLKNSFTLSPAAGGFSETGTQYRTALFTLMAIVALVLLIACANVANLLLARASARQREIAVRMAIGASRARIIRQLLTESLLLSLLGACGGFLLALAGSRLLIRLISTAANPINIDISPDLRVLGFTLAVTGLTALLFGLVPALRATRVELDQALKENARSAAQGSSRFNLGKVLIASQVALSLILLVGSGLFLGTLRNLLTIDLGFRTQHVLVIRADLEQSSVAKSRRVQVYGDILDRLRTVPGVVSASSSQIVPISRGAWGDTVLPEGFNPASPKERFAFFNRISPQYFKTLRTPLLIGRDFDAHDDLLSPKVMIINEAAALYFFGSLNIIGKTIGVNRSPDKSGGPDLYEVIGVVGNAKYLNIDEDPMRTVYLASAQDTAPSPSIGYEVRSSGPVEQLVPSIRKAIAQMNRDASLEFRNFETQVNDSLLQPRIVALLSTAFGILALILAMVGLYGVTSYTVARRKSEIGIRMALGEQRQSVTWLMLREVLVMLVVGLALGLITSLSAGRLVASLLYGIKPNDPVQLALAVLVLAAAATLAAYLPARRAARLDPMAALRQE